MYQRDENVDDPLVTSLLRILHHLEEGERKEEFNDNYKIYLDSFDCETESVLEERVRDVRSRQITPRTWNLLHGRRGKLSFRNQGDQRDRDFAVVTRKSDDLLFQRSYRYERGSVDCGVGCAADLNEVSGIRDGRCRLITSDRRIFQTDNTKRSPECVEQIATLQNSHQTHLTGEYISRLICSPSSIKSSKRLVTSSNSVCRLNDLNADQARRQRRWSNSLFSSFDEDSTESANEVLTDSSVVDDRPVVRPRSAYMVSSSCRTSESDLSSRSSSPVPVDSDCSSHFVTEARKKTDIMIKQRETIPKSKRAPDPPDSIQCETVGKNNMSVSDISNIDHEGWVMDQLHGKRVWCILADMLFCTFDSKEATESKEIIMLPGCKVRSLVFKSANREGLLENVNNVSDNRKKTISGVDRFQFLVDNVTSKRKYLFGVETKSELDIWVQLLTHACSVDAENLENLESTCDSVGDHINANSVYQPTNHRCRRLDIISMSLEDSKLNVADTHETIVHFKRRLRQDSDSEVKLSPMKAKHTSNGKKEVTIKPKSKSFLKLKTFGSLDSLLRRDKRSRKCEAMDKESDDDEWNTSSVTRNESEHEISQHVLNLSSSQSASDLKDKMFSAKYSPRNIGLKLEDLTDIRMCGYLLYLNVKRWIDVWCVVSRGCLYGFKSQESCEHPVVAVVLTRCSVTYVTDRGQRNDKLYVFTLSQPHCKTIYLCAQEESELSKWLQVLQMEASHVLAEDSIETSDLSYSVDSTFSTMSLSSSQSDVTDRGEGEINQPDKQRLDNGDVSSSGTDNSNDCMPVDWDYDNSGLVISDNTLRHDPSVTRVWQKDKGYLFQVIRAKLRKKRSLSTFGKSSISQELPGPQSGGLLILHDDEKEEDDHNDSDDVVHGNVNEISASSRPDSVQATRTHVFWNSDGLEDQSMTSRIKEMAQLKTVSERAESSEDALSLMNGCLEKRGFNGQWTRFWYVIKDECLYCYLTPDDNVPVDITELNGYSVSTLVDEFRGKRFVVHLNHEDYVALYLSAESRDEMEQWVQALNEAIKLSETSSNSNCRPQTVKEKLLAEVLRQKQELEKKQAARQHRDSSQVSDPVGEHISAVTRLKQRRLSTQIKMSSIQKQLDNKNGMKKTLFNFGKKKSDSSNNLHLTEQLKELSEKLQQIDTSLSSQTAGNTVKRNGSLNCGTSDINLNKSIDFEDSVFKDFHVHRSNSLKSSVQRFAHRTFAKAGWKKNRKSNAFKTDEVDGTSESSQDMQDYIDLTSHSQDYTDVTSHEDDCSLDLSSGGDSQPQSPNSPGDSNLRVYLSASLHSLPDSSESNQTSPRREVNPSVMAQIKEFEDFSRQMMEKTSIA